MSNEEPKFSLDDALAFTKNEVTTKLQYLSTTSVSIDKAILSLSGGALGLSIVFVREIAPNKQCLNALVVAWICFGIALLSVLLGMVRQRKQAKQELQDAVSNFNAVMNATQQPDADKTTVTLTHLVIPVKEVLWFNHVAIVAFLVGAVSLVFFVLRNL